MKTALPVTALSHVAIRVPDPKEAAEFYRRVLGLVETGRDLSTGSIRLSTLPWNATAVSHHELILYRGEPSGLDHVAFAVPDEAALNAAADLLRARGVAVEGLRNFEGVHGPSLRVLDSEGLTVELIVPPPLVARPPGRSPVDLIKLSHVNLKSPNPPARARWWREVMDFRLSDQMGDVFFWLRCNRDHTTVAIVRSETTGIHHLAFEIASWEDVCRLADHFAANNVRIEFGPGRHGPGKSVFMYFLDPWRIRWEMLCEIVRIDDEINYRPGFWEGDSRKTVVNLWGPQPPETFLSW